MSLEHDRAPQFVSVTERAEAEPYIRQAAGRVGLKLVAFHTERDAAVAAYIEEGQRLTGDPVKAEVFGVTAEAMIRKGGAVFHLASNEPDVGITHEQIDMFNCYWATLDPGWPSGPSEDCCM